MADLKTFAAFDINTLYTDVADSEKGFHGAHATMVHNGYASPPVGAVNLDNPGGATRSLTQWNGAAYAGFLANSPGSYQAPAYYFNLANCALAQDIGSGNPGFNFDSNDFMDYDRANNVWRLLIGGVTRVRITAAAIGFGLTNPEAYGAIASQGGKAGAANSNLALITPGAVQGEQANVALYSTFVGTADNGPRRAADVVAGFSTGIWNTEYLSLCVGNNGLPNDGKAVTDEKLRITSTNRIIQKGVTDDGVTALQTTSYSASNQPSLTGGSNPTALSIPVNTSPPLQIPTRTLKGGMIVYNSDQNIAVPVAGLYLLSGKILFNVAVQSTRVIVSLFKNASLFNYQSDFPPVPGNTYIVDLNAQIPMLASDVIILTATVNSAGSTPSAARITDLSFTKIN